MQILALSPYHAGSHSRWLRELKSQFPEHIWTTLTLPPRAFSWRYAGNAFSLYERHKAILSQGFDLILATSMTNLIALRGLVPKLADIRTILYFHENQFFYPMQHANVERERFHFCMQSIYAAMAADALVFNSEHNQHTFLEGVRGLLRKMPDHAPKKVVERLTQRSRVLPVPISDIWFQSPPKKSGPLQILWNHRWEYDKAPDRFFNALTHLNKSGHECVLHVVGQSFKNKPDCFSIAQNKLQSWIQTWGYLPDIDAYQKLLLKADIVVSTALHEFQGLSVLEAAASGCHVLAPHRLAYPEWFENDSLYASFPDNPDAELDTLCNILAQHMKDPEHLRKQSTPDINKLHWSNCRKGYERLLTEESNS